MNKYAEKMLELIEAEKKLRDIVNEIADIRDDERPNRWRYM